jgi:transposase
VAVSREHRPPETARLDKEQLKRTFLGWLHDEHEHYKMAAIPTLAEEAAKRPHRERETLVGEQTSIVNRIKANLGLGHRDRGIGDVLYTDAMKVMPAAHMASRHC